MIAYLTMKLRRAAYKPSDVHSFSKADNDGVWRRWRPASMDAQGAAIVWLNRGPDLAECQPWDVVTAIRMTAPAEPADPHSLITEEMTMSDDKSSQDSRDRSKVAGREDYEVRYFADKHGISPDEVREMIARVGNQREALEAEIARSGAQGDA